MRILNKHCIEIEKINNSSKNSYTSGGIIEEYKTPKKMNFQSFNNNFLKPS